MPHSLVRRSTAIVVSTIVLALASGCGSGGSTADKGDSTQTTGASGVASTVPGGTGTSGTTVQSDPGGTRSERPAGNAVITEYCDAVQQYVDKADKLQADPSDSDLMFEVTKLGMDVGAQGGRLAGQVPSFSAAENEKFQACLTRFTTANLAVIGLVGG